MNRTLALPGPAEAGEALLALVGDGRVARDDAGPS